MLLTLDFCALSLCVEVRSRRLWNVGVDGRHREVMGLANLGILPARVGR